jgi:hypothetical protein
MPIDRSPSVSVTIPAAVSVDAVYFWGRTFDLSLVGVVEVFVDLAELLVAYFEAFLAEVFFMAFFAGAFFATDCLVFPRILLDFAMVMISVNETKLALSSRQYFRKADCFRPLGIDGKRETADCRSLTSNESCEISPPFNRYFYNYARIPSEFC